METLALTRKHFVRRTLIVFACSSALISTSGICASQDPPVFRPESQSAVVWGADMPGGASASTARDPLTGGLIKRLTFHGLDVSSSNGVSKRQAFAWGPPYSMTVWITVVNNTNAPVSVGNFTSTLRRIDFKNLKKARVRCYDESPPPSGTIAPGGGQRFAAVLELSEPGPPPTVRYSVRVGGRDWVFVWTMQGFEDKNRIPMPDGCSLASRG
jgi:hypothetical protein